MISVTAILRLGRDAEVRDVNGKSEIEFTGASTEKRAGGEVPTWCRVSYWRDPGKLIAYLTKGTQVAVTGTLTAREYKGRDGTTKTSLDIRASEIELIGSKRDDANGASAGKHTRANAEDYVGGDESLPF